jgi:hypothetical protein
MIEFILGDWNSVISIVARLQAERSGVGIRVGVRDFFLLQNGQTGSEPHPASYSMATRAGTLYSEI